MISVLSTNITSPLGYTTEQNYQAVRAGRSALRRYDGLWGLTEPFAASLFSEEQKVALALDGYTSFEALAIHSVREALSHIQLDVTSPKVILILSTTKGNVDAMNNVRGTMYDETRYYPSDAALAIAKAIGLTTKPIVVCNACVSGLSAQLLADHLLTAGLYDYAIVVGAEVQSKFIVSGFQSLKAVSDEPCRPFDIERNGLNPGEAAATIVFTNRPSKSPLKGDSLLTSPSAVELCISPFKGNCLLEAEQLGSVSDGGQKLEGVFWHLIDGATSNDAYHNVSPSPQGDGLTTAINAVMKGRDKSQLAMVCVHGTATLYNDQMEAVAIHRAGLSDTPLSALKGYYGHTMGAAGVLETILTMRATDDGIVLPTKGFTELGVSKEVSISTSLQKTDKRAFLKLMSGFGGCNVAALFERTTVNGQKSTDRNLTLTKTHTTRLSSEDGLSLTDIYKQQIGDYPKFYKMDILSRLAFVVAEKTLSNFCPPSLTLSNCSASNRQLPLKGENSLPLREGWGGSLILFNHSSSIASDRQFLSTISDAENCFPSPSVFVYTLPNIAAGEIAIRHHLTGETAFYILPDRDEALMQQILEATLRATGATRAVCGWVDAESETNFECELSIFEMKSEY